MRRQIVLIFIIVAFLASSRSAWAFWVWTPETNKWINPKYAVKETPREQFEYAKGFYDAQDYPKAIEEFRKLIRHYPKAREAAEAQYYTGLAQEAQEYFYAAFKSYQVVIEKYPFSDRGPEIIGRQYAIGTKLLEGQDQQNQFVNAVIGGDYNIVDVYRTVIKNSPYGEFAAPSQYKIGLYLLEKHLYQEARDELEKVVNDYPQSEWAQAAKYQIALSDAKRSAGPQYDQAVTKAAIEEFKKFTEHYPDAELSAKAREQVNGLREKEAENNFVIAQFYEKKRQYESARLYYETIVNDFSTTSWAPKALEKIRSLSQKIK